MAMAAKHQGIGDHGHDRRDHVVVGMGKPERPVERWPQRQEEAEEEQRRLKSDPEGPQPHVAARMLGGTHR
jgi:hypothetical protein